MGSWNYRVLVSEHKDTSYYEIYEVYYDNNGKPNGYTERPSTIYSDENTKGLKWTLDKMSEALSKPLLSKENFPSEYVE